MNEQAAAGWYPDGQGNQRYWDGSAWTDQVRQDAEMPAVPKKPSAFSKLGSAVKSAAAERKAAKEEFARKQAEAAEAAGALVTSGIFGSSTVEIYENGFVRVGSWAQGVTASGAKAVDKDTPYEKLRSIKFTQPESGSSEASASLESAVGPAVAKLFKGGKGLMKASAPGMAAAGIGHLASNAARKSFLTIATDKQIHTLTNQTTNSVGLKTSNKGHNEVAVVLEAAGNSVLGVVEPTSRAPIADEPSIVEQQSPAQAEPAVNTPAPAATSVGDRLRELAELHKEGILSDDEFAAAKAKLLNNL